MNKQRRTKLNKTVLTLFLTIAIVTWLSKLTIGILYDFGYFSGSFEFEWWKKYIFEGIKPTDLATIDALKKRPQFLWMLTQFTWLTTTVMIVFLFFRFYAFDEKVPKWLRWIRSQRTLSIIMIYELVVLILFWTALSVSRIQSITGALKLWETIVTIMVHAVLPTLFTIYAIIFLTNDRHASLLREDFVLKGMLWPIIYALYYIVVALTWNDPYPLTNFGQNFWPSFGRVIGALFCTYALIGLMMIGHNFILLRYNSQYRPTHDTDALTNRDFILAKIAKKAGKKFAKKNKRFHAKLTQLNAKIVELERKWEQERKTKRKKIQS